MSAAAAALPSQVGGAIETVLSFKAPLLDRILDHDGDPEQRCVILDLGGPSQLLIERLAATRACRIEIASLAQYGLEQITEFEASEEKDPRLLEDLLPTPSEDLLDIIFCWDLPNYMSLDTLKRFTNLFGKRAAPGCKLHMLIAYSKREMADFPAAYTPQADGNLLQNLANAELKPAPRYSPEDLGIAAGGFRYERGVLLSNGMQEFVYAWPGRPGG